MRDDSFEWDDRKAEANLKKHEVSFDEVRYVFDDPDAIDLDDPDPDEVRTKTLGRVDRDVFVVIWTEREGLDGITRRRIISAREATPNEEGIYRNG